MAFFDQLAENIKKGTNKVLDKTQNLTDTVRINSKISSEKDKISDAYKAIGEAYYNQHCTEESGDFAESFAIINGAKAAIDELTAELQKLKGVRLCPECSGEVPKESTFCPKCGNKMPEIVEETPVEETVSAPTNVCTNCGAAVSEESAFCTECGTPVQK